MKWSSWPSWGFRSGGSVSNGRWWPARGRICCAAWLVAVAAGALLLHAALVPAGIIVGFLAAWWAGLALALVGVYHLVAGRLPKKLTPIGPYLANFLVVLLIGVLLTRQWEPLGPERGLPRNLIFVGALVGVLLGSFKVFRSIYRPMLSWCLRHKVLFLSIPLLLLLLGATVWLGFEQVFAFLSTLPWPGRKIGVLGAMKELGRESAEAHRRVGRQAALCDFQGLFLFGEEMEDAYLEEDHIVLILPDSGRIEVPAVRIDRVVADEVEVVRDEEPKDIACGLGWTEEPLPDDTPFSDLIRMAAEEADLHPLLLASLVRAESAFDPTAVSGSR